MYLWGQLGSYGWVCAHRDNWAAMDGCVPIVTGFVSSALVFCPSPDTLPAPPPCACPCPFCKSQVGSYFLGKVPRESGGGGKRWSWKKVTRTTHVLESLTRRSQHLPLSPGQHPVRHLLGCSSPLLYEKTRVLGNFLPVSWIPWDVFLIRNTWAQKCFGFQIISPFPFFMCVYACLCYAGFCMCVGMQVWPCMWNPRLILGIILYCSYTLFFKARSFNQTQSSLIWLVLLVSLLWGSCLCLLGL